MSQNFRLGKVNEIAAKLAKAAVHYRLVRKKYKRAKTLVNWLVGCSSGLRAVASNASLASALSAIGLVAAVPLGAVSGCFALPSPGLIIVAKKLQAKITKHQE